MAYERETDDHYCSVVLFSFCSSLLFILELIDDNTVNATFIRQGAHAPPQGGKQILDGNGPGWRPNRGSTEHPASAFLVRVTARTIPDGLTKLSHCSCDKKTRCQQSGVTPGHHFLGRGSSGTDYYYCDDLPHGRGILSFTEKWNWSTPEQSRGSCPHREKTAIRRSGQDMGEGKRQGRNQSQPCCLQASFTRVVSPLMKRGWVLRAAVRSRRMPSALACSL